MPHLAAALLILLLLPATASGQAGVSYQVPADNPFAGQAGAAPEVYAIGLRNPFRFSFDRLTGDVFIGDVGGGLREEINWVTRRAARGANFGWACREGALGGPRPEDCPVPGAIEPFFEYSMSGPRAVTGGFVVRDPSLAGLAGRYVYADYYAGVIRSLALDPADPDDTATGLTLTRLASFGEDAAGRLYAARLEAGEVMRLVAGAAPEALDAEPLAGPFSQPIALATVPGDASRLFVVEREGKVRLVENGAVLAAPFLDVEPFGLSTDGERGLLSVAAAPDYPTSGKVYVYYTDAGGDIRIDEFTRSAGDPDSAAPTSRRNLLAIEHSQASNHNGGQLHFGPDGCLWITTGDGGGQNNQYGNAQNRATLLGKLLRIDPDPPGVGGPPCGGTPQRDQPAEPAVGDTRAPALAVRVPRRQRVLRLRGAIAYLRCDEACTLAAGGTLRIGRRKLLLRRATGARAANVRARLRVRPRPRARRLLRRALARQRRPKVVLRLRARDAAGNRSAPARRVVSVRR